MFSSQPLLDAAGRRRSPATTPGARAGIPPRNKGQTYPADPPTVDEIVAVMRQAGDNRHGHRVNALNVVLWRAGLRIQEALSLAETDFDQRRGSILVRHGKNDRRREVGMDAWGWSAYSDLGVMPSSAEESLQAPTFAVPCVSRPPCWGGSCSSTSATRICQRPEPTSRASTPRRSSPPSTRGARR
jgi:hypothetical protein